MECFIENRFVGQRGLFIDLFSNEKRNKINYFIDLKRDKRTKDVSSGEMLLHMKNFIHCQGRTFEEIFLYFTKSWNVNEWNIRDSLGILVKEKYVVSIGDIYYLTSKDLLESRCTYEHERFGESFEIVFDDEEQD